MKTSKIVFVLLLLLNNFTFAQTWDNLTYNNNQTGLHTNPVRGLIPGFDGVRNFPYSMEFIYIPLRNTMNNINNFNWTEFETKLEEVANRGNTAVPRFYLDYPGSEIATPQFLIDAGITMNDYTVYGNDPGESKSPDYNNPLTMNALLNFIENFGAEYNGDQRISVIQGGIVGFWGEWHNYPLTTELGMTEDNKRIIFEKFIEEFPNTKINIRTPQDAVSPNTELQVGYHDDSFAYSTLGPLGWHFWPQIINAGLSTVWQNHPIGGEIRPELQSTIWQTIPNIEGQDFETCVNTTHTTYLLNHGVFDDAVGSTTYNNALIQNNKLGYKFYVNGVKLNEYQNGIINVDVRLENRGIAPFYYNWQVELALFKDNVVTSLGTTSWNINTIQPNDIVIKNFTANQALQTGNYTILMRFVNPLTALKPNAKQLRFANNEQDNHQNGWLSLKTFQVSTLSNNNFENKSDLIVYPNPTTNYVNFNFPEKIESITLYNLLGQEVLSKQVNSQEFVIDVCNFSNGTYIVKLNTNGKIQTFKLVKI